jgi:predicted ArsR family transcriptional regulator
MSVAIESHITDIFESNPFRKANVVTIQTHLAAKGLDISEPEVRNHCERLVEANVLEFDQTVYGRATYSYPSE